MADPLPLPAPGVPLDAAQHIHILAGHTAHPFAAFKDYLASSLAHSYATNSRKIEAHWYAPWSSVLFSLISDIPTAFVAPQFPLWVEQEDDNHDEDNHEEDRDGSRTLSHDPFEQDDPGSVSDGNTRNQTRRRQREDPQPPNENQSSAICTVSIPCSNLSSRVPDFSVLLTEGSEVPLASLPMFCFGIDVTRMIVGAIVENKTGVSRRMTDPIGHKDALSLLLDEAKDDLLNQAAHLFLNYKNQTEVIAIAAAGAEWTFTSLTREHVFKRMTDFKKADPSYNLRNNTDRIRVNWRDPVVLGTLGSIRYFRYIHDYLQRKARTGAHQLRHIQTALATDEEPN